MNISFGSLRSLIDTRRSCEARIHLSYAAFVPRRVKVIAHVGYHWRLVSSSYLHLGICLIELTSRVVVNVVGKGVGVVRSVP